MPVRAARLTTLDELEWLAPEWRALLAASAHDEPTLSPTWMLSWWRVFGDGRKLQALALRDGATLIGLAPLLSRVHWYRGALPFRRLELMASGEDEADETCSDYIGVIAARGREEAVALAVADWLYDQSWDELVLPALDGTKPIGPLLVGALRARGIAASLDDAGGCPYIPLPGTWDDYLRALPSQRRYLVTRSLRDFEKWAGTAPSLTIARTRAELDEGKAILHALHGDRWGQGGLFRSTRFVDFHERVMAAFLDEGALELAWLSAHGRPIAALYNFVWRRKVRFYQSGRALDLPKNIRAGIVAHAAAIQHSIAQQRVEYDFLAGASQYKTQLALEVRPLLQLRAVRATLRERARITVEEVAKRARRAPAKEGGS